MRLLLLFFERSSPSKECLRIYITRETILVANKKKKNTSDM